jgi:sugar porter (SP) family MFS transporter
MNTQKPADLATQLTGFVGFATFIIALGGLLYGYNATVMAGAILFIKKQYALSPLFEESVIASVVVGALIGAAIGGPLADRYGRRWALMLTSVVFLFGAIASASAPNVLSLIGARTLAGTGIGLVSVVGTLYLAEVSPDHLRGRLVSIYMVANFVGVIGGYLVELAFDADGSWRWMLGFPAFIAIPFAVGAWALSETPRWLICNHRLDRARAALGRICKDTDVDQELQHLQASVGSRRGNWSDLLAAELRPALVIGVALGLLQRVTGITIAFLYGPTIFRSAGMQSVSLDIWAGVGVGIAFLIGQVLSLVLVDHLGRRPLLLLGYGGMAVALVLLGVTFAMGSELALVQWLSVGGVILLAGAWAAGPASVTFLIISEIYPQDVRGPAMSLATVALWLSFLVMTFTFLTTIELLGESLTFLAYGLFSVIAVGVVCVFVPETKGKSLEQISAGLVRRK